MRVLSIAPFLPFVVITLNMATACVGDIEKPALQSPATAPATQPAGPVKDGLQVSARTEVAIEAGSPIDIVVTVTNVSDKEVKVLQTIPEWDFLFIVSDKHGGAVPLTAFGSKARDDRGRKPVARVSLRLRPGEQHTESIRLNRLYDLSLAGKYSVVVEYAQMMLDPARTTWAIPSNSLEIEVTAPEH